MRLLSVVLRTGIAMNAKESARHDCMFGRRQSDGRQGEGGEQLVLDCFNTDSAQDDTTFDI